MNQSDWDALDARLKELRTMTGPHALAGYAEVLAALDEHLAQCLVDKDGNSRTTEKLKRLAGDLREVVEKLKGHGTRHELGGRLRGPPFFCFCLPPR